MTKKEAIKLFEDKKVRTLWNIDQERWYFAIVDIIAMLTDQKMAKCDLPMLPIQCEK